MFTRNQTQQERSQRYSAIENNLLRTFSPKHANYFGDGSGRDTYVVTDNGGLMDREKNGMTRRPFKNTLQNRDQSPGADPMPINYHADGTGRDTYVISNAGGLVCDYFGSKRSDVNFMSSLRHQNKSVMPRIYDPADITNYVGYMDPRTKRQMQESAKKAKDVTLRLSPSPSNYTSPKVSPISRSNPLVSRK